MKHATTYLYLMHLLVFLGESDGGGRTGSGEVGKGPLHNKRNFYERGLLANQSLYREHYTGLTCKERKAMVNTRRSCVIVFTNKVEQ